MIFATCGSTPLGFKRMMQALSALPPEELIVQHGPMAPPPGAAAHDFLPFGRIVELMEEADAVVSHAGVGSIMCALQAGHCPIVFPRLKRYAETVDDHQAELAAALEQRGTVMVATSGDELLAALAAVPGRGAHRTLHGAELNAAVHAAVRGESAHTLRARLRGQPVSALSYMMHRSKSTPESSDTIVPSEAAASRVKLSA